MNEEQRNITKGLQTELHPALRSSNLNLIRSKRENPYLDDNAKVPLQAKKKRQLLRFYKPGEFIAKANQLRAAHAQQLVEEKEQMLRKEEEECIRKNKIRLGDLPDVNEIAYLETIKSVPSIEWWDKKFVNSNDGEIHEKYLRSYDNICDTSQDDSVEEDERPSIRFVKHPIPITKKVGSNSSVITKIYLTKKEQKKKRRNQRKIMQQERETRIKLNLESKPEPKVKLANMMRVLESNHNIQDPTRWEQVVREQVKARKEKHLKTNTQRHLEAIELRQKAGFATYCAVPNHFCKVYKFNHMNNPKIRYKILTNGKQLYLKGCCLHINQGPGIIVTVGNEKSSNFFEKLVTKRIKWSEPFQIKHNTETITCTDATCSKIWEGIVAEHKFRGWFMTECQNSQELINILSRSGGSPFFHLDLHFLTS